MILTIDKPETEARLLRFASSRGLTPMEALDALLDAFEEGVDAFPWETMPEVLRHPAPDAMRKALADLDAGKGIDGADFLAELRDPNPR